MVKEKADSVSKKSNGEAKIIIAGDFNCTPDDNEIAILTGNDEKLNSPENISMINLSELSADKGLGTYKYMGTWEMIDQVIVSEPFLKCHSGYYTGDSLLTVFRPDFLLQRDQSYPGFRPFSTYLGYRYQGGFSDHLPVILELRLK